MHVLALLLTALELGGLAHAQSLSAGRRLGLGDACLLKDGRPGVCTKFEECPAATDDIRKGKPITNCFFTHFVATPCCPTSQEPSVTTPTPTTTTTASTTSSTTTSTTTSMTRQLPPKPVPTPTRVPSSPNSPTTTSRRPPASDCLEPIEDWSPTPDEERSLRQLAEQKCIEYRKYVYQLEQVPTLVITDKTKLYENRSTCAMDREPLIVGGVPAAPQEFPHMAVIGFGARKDNNWQCGGSLISSRHIVTAAHCVRSSAGCARWVLLGALLLNETNSNSEPQEFEIVHRIKHPRYVPPRRYNDIAIFELDRDVDFTGYVRPACLYTDFDPPENDKGIAIGFGRQEWLSSEGSNKLMKVTLPFQPYEKCNVTYNISSRLPNGLDDNGMLCAGDLRGNKDTCQGDSGGPLQVRDIENCMYKVTGVTSFGSPVCGQANSPAVYTRISSYVPWISKTVWA